MKTRPTPFHAVVTGDLVDSSSKSAPGEPARVLKQLRSIFALLKRRIRGFKSFQIFRGDSFQTIVDDPDDAFRAALLLRCHCLLHIELDLRVAIGVGLIQNLPVGSVGESTGPAFTYSGHALDEMVEPRRFLVTTPDQEVNSEMLALTALMDAVVRSWSKRALSVMAERLSGEKQEAIAAALDISQSAVSQRLAVAQWWAVEAGLRRWTEICRHFTKPYK